MAKDTKKWITGLAFTYKSGATRSIGCVLGKASQTVPLTDQRVLGLGLHSTHFGLLGVLVSGQLWDYLMDCMLMLASLLARLRIARGRHIYWLAGPWSRLRVHPLCIGTPLTLTPVNVESMSRIDAVSRGGGNRDSYPQEMSSGCGGSIGLMHL